MNMAYRPSLAGCQQWRLDNVAMSTTYSFEVVDLAYSAHRLCSFDNRDGLDRNAVAEAGAFTVHNTWDEDVSLYTILLAGRDDFVVRINGLEDSLVSDDKLVINVRVRTCLNNGNFGVTLFCIS